MSFKEKVQRVVSQIRTDAGMVHAKVSRTTRGIERAMPKKLSNKQVLKEKNKVTIVENQPVYSKDKSRFFKEAWKEEKRQLYFK